MGVISFGDDRPVFGSSASFIRGLIDQAIGMHGEKDYLRHLRYQMEWAYNAIYMEELHVDEIREFASAIEPYRGHYLSLPDLHEITRESVEQLTDDLAAAIKIYVAQRVATGRLNVERDLWTLRSARDAARRLGEQRPFFADLESFISELVEWMPRELRDEVVKPATKDGLPLKLRLAKLGADIGKFLDNLNHPEALFRLIEDGMDGANEDLADAIHRNLIPAMVEASAKAETWDALQRHFGSETRKWAMEHYDFEIYAPEELAVFPSELQRIEDLIDAARVRDWRRFKALSEEPFINEETMRDDQFAMASAAISKMKMCALIEASATMVRGNRLVHAIVGDPTSKARITVMMTNVGNREGGPFGVLLFARQKRPFGPR